MNIDISNNKTIDKILENNFRTKVTYLPSLCHDMKIGVTESNITYVDSGFTSDTFNVVFGGDFTGKHIENDIKNLVNYYTSNNMSLAWWIGSTIWSKETDKLLTSYGLALNETETGMAANSEDIDIRYFKGSANLQVVEVSNLEQFKDYGHVLASVFNPYDHEAVEFYKKVGQFFESGNIKMYVGYIEGEAAVISSLVIEGDFGGIYDVATNPKFQRQGLGTYMTSVAIETLKSLGCNVIGMQASEEGKPLYEKLGFNSYGTFRVYSNEKLLN